MSTNVHLSPVPLVILPKKDGAPDLTDAALPGYEAAQMHIPPLEKWIAHTILNMIVVVSEEQNNLNNQLEI